MHRYMITFSHVTEFGATFVALDLPFKRPISSVEEIEALTSRLRKEGYNNPFVIAFSPFATNTAANQPGQR
ncbi:hypothetical protein AB0M79_09660 [Polymorphospora sp. NPDC051019]|uniref:hypothetical protein n=1 Tax=Polymorphospora sp. NPDC051019 TaxID=3155725 RepID=UPI003412AE23